MSLEAALRELDAKVEEAQRAADALAKAVRRLRSMASVGNVQQLERQLSVLPELAQIAGEAVSRLDGAWTFDARGHVENGYTAELLAAAEGRVPLFEKEGRLFAFPYIIRLAASDPSIRLGRTAERGLRPTIIVDKLAALLGRPQKANEQRFLELLYRAYQRLAGQDWRRLERGQGPAIPLVDVHEVITLLPSADYPAEEFGRDLLYLDRRPDLRTRDGTAFALAGSTMGKTSRKIVIYDEHGNTREFIAIRFSKGA